MKNRKGNLLMTLGLVLILAALALVGYNQWDASRAQQESDDALMALEQIRIQRQMESQQTAAPPVITATMMPTDAPATDAPITDAPMPMTLIFFAAMRQYAVFHIVVLAKDKQGFIRNACNYSCGRIRSSAKIKATASDGAENASDHFVAFFLGFSWEKAWKKAEFLFEAPLD
jgi:type II secretory pathway pseudopilin PulG